MAAAAKASLLPVKDDDRSFSIDVWRGMAISLVLLLHAYATVPGLNLPLSIDLYFHNMGVGVQLFFVLSGYLISESWDRCKTVTEFYVRRVAKIGPLYYLFLALSISMFVLSTKIGGEPSGYLRNGITAANLTIGNFLTHLFFLQGLSPTNINSLLDGSWSVVNEVYFYLFYPLIRQFLVRGVNSAVLFWVGATLVQAVAAEPVYATWKSGAFLQYYPLAALPSFGLGMIIYWVNRQTFGAIKPLTIAAGLIVLFASVVWFQRELLLVQNMLLPSLLPVIMLARWPRNAVTHVLQKFGEQTYSLYFVHLFVLTWAYNLVLPHITQVGHLGLGIITLLLAFPFSYILSSLIFNKIDNYLLHRIVAAYLRDQAGAR